MISLFPETPPICFGCKHFKFIEKCLLYPNGILQKELVKKLEFDKTSVSEIKHDLIKLGWVKDIDLGSGREIIVKICRLNEIKIFVRQWQSVQQAIFVRPHSIKYKGLFLEKPDNFEKIVNSRMRKFKVSISEMKNNKEYAIETDYGKVVFLLKGKLITFWIEEFILPVYEWDLPYFEDYIKEGIMDRFFKLHSLLKEHFSNFSVCITNCFYLKSLHLGIITKGNISKILSLKELGLFSDKSIYGCKEIEAKGKLDVVLNRIKSCLNTIFEEEKTKSGGDSTIIPQKH